MKSGNLNFFIVCFSILLFCNSTNSFGQQKPKKTKDTSSEISLQKGCGLTNDEAEHIFSRTDVLANFKGGSETWFEFAQSNFDFQYVATHLPDTIQHFQDSIVVQFIVTRKGNICSITTLKGNELLKTPSEKLLRLSPSWEPASSSGRNLNAYRTLRIDISIDNQLREFKVLRNYKEFFRENDN